MVKIKKNIDFKKVTLEALEKSGGSNYLMEYRKNHYRRYELRMNLESDKDLIDKLDKIENKNEYIKKALRAYRK